MKRANLFLYVLISAFLLSGCSNWSNTGKGAAIGAGSGGAIGGLIGSKKGNTAGGAIIGAAVGGVAGAAIGKYMDKQAQELEAIENAQVERVEEGIKITFESGILFGFDSYALTAESQQSVLELAEILNKYPETNLVIEGHTDNRGSASYNQGLSERRANAVANYLKMKGVSSDRVTTIGLGFDKPVDTNETDEGRAKNRRVEIGISANDDLVEKAESGDLE